MSRALAILLVVLLPALLADAGPVRNHKAGRALDEYQLVFLDTDAGSVVDVGRVVASHCASPRASCMRTIVKRKFRLRVDGNGVSRFVRVSAFVQGDGGRQRVRLDGAVLSSAPQLISASTPLRVPVVHTLEIEVPVSEPDGPLLQSVVWLVEDAQ